MTLYEPLPKVKTDDLTVQLSLADHVTTNDANTSLHRRGPKETEAYYRDGDASRGKTAQDDGDGERCKITIEDQDEPEGQSKGCFARTVEQVDTKVKCFALHHSVAISRGLVVVFVLAYFTYFGYCMCYRFGDLDSVTLLVVTLLVTIKVLWNRHSHHIPSIPADTWEKLSTPKGLRLRKVGRYILYLAATVTFVLYFALIIFQENPRNLQPLIGLLLFIFICFVLSKSPSKVNWHPVFWGFILQFAFAFLTLRTRAGYETFDWLGDQVRQLLHYSEKGSEFVLGKQFRTMGLAFTFSGILIFCNALIFMLNHVGAIEFVVLKLGMFLHHCLGTGPVESVIAAANIFLGLSEAPLLIRPYLETVSMSELHAIMTCGFASIAGSTMAIFIGAGAPANHLLTAAIISAPSALAITKLLYPETENVDYSKQTNIKMATDKGQQSSILQACSEGAVQAVPLLVAIMANMLAFVSILALIDGLLDWLGQRAGYQGLTFDFICSYVLYPVSYGMGVPTEDCGKVGSLIGIKLFATPVVGFATLGEIINNRHTFEDYIASTNSSWHWDGQDVVLEATNTTLVRGFMAVRSEVIATYAMCGFSAFTAIGICMGSLIPMCPARKEDIVQLILLSFLGGNIASFATGSVAGMMYTGL